jgi:hypothetical protein
VAAGSHRRLHRRKRSVETVPNEAGAETQRCVERVRLDWKLARVAFGDIDQGVQARCGDPSSRNLDLLRRFFDAHDVTIERLGEDDRRAALAARNIKETALWS